jgi:hypothetical protein
LDDGEGLDRTEVDRQSTTIKKRLSEPPRLKEGLDPQVRQTKGRARCAAFAIDVKRRSCTATDVPSAEASCEPPRATPRCKAPTYILRAETAATISGTGSVFVEDTTGPWTLAGSPWTITTLS